ncbi:MAG TPA: immunoglobulin domain-containing protein [Candidatus Acidoferrum sp.]|nr:immunoglobulin domain-containing protein [Candidatus Acidoferrum sp.]
MNSRLRFIVLSVVLVAGCARAQSVGSVTGWGDNSWGQLTFPPGLTNIVAVAAGVQHSAALRDDGTVVVWGDDSTGQISSKPAGLGGVRSIAAGDYHTVALRNNGTVVAWGYDLAQTNVPAGLTSVRAIAAGNAYSLALRSNGTVVAWGSGTAATVPGGLANVTAIAAGGQHALALLANGTVVAWGVNTLNQANVPPGLSGVRLITAGGTHSIALKTDGTYVGWGDATHGKRTVPAAANNVVALFSGANHSGAVRTDGRVICWGDNTLGQTNSLGISNVVTAVSHANHNLAIVLQRPSITTEPISQNVSAGQFVSFVVVASGSPTLAYQWRKNGTNIPGAFNASYTISSAQATNAGGYSVVVTNAIGSVTSLVATLTVSTGPSITTHPQSQTVALNSNVMFTVVATGDVPLRYQWKKDNVNIPNATNTFLQINSAQPGDAGTYHVVVTNLLGSATSSNAVLTVVIGPTILEPPQGQDVLAGSSVTFTVVATNALSYQWVHENTNVPGATSPMFTINRASPTDAGTYSVIVANGFGAIASTPVSLTVQTPTNPSDVVMWGQDAVLVNGEFIDMAAPLGLVGVKAVTAGDAFNLALRLNGMVVGWGDNQYGQAGLPPNVIATAIAAGANHTLVITNNRVGAWGLNTSGQTTPPDITNAVAIAAAANLSMALREDGVVFVWGDTSAGQHILPPSVTNITGIAAGVEHCLALRSNGTVVGWAGNTFGQARAPFAVTNINAGVAAIAAGAYHSLALKSNGTVVAWGKNTFTQTNVPPEATNIAAIAAGSEHSMALRRDGVVICWGNNNFGQSETPPGLFASAIGGGAARSMAIRKALLKLFAPVRISPTQIRIEVRNGDGSLIPNASATNIQVFASTDVTLATVNWTKLTNTVSVSTNGTATFTDNSTAQPRFFYQAR